MPKKSPGQKELAGDAPPPDDHGKNTAAVELGRKGGQARARLLSKSQRSRIAKQAALIRWQKTKPDARSRRGSAA
jgi:hypothetical protein